MLQSFKYFTSHLFDQEQRVFTAWLRESNTAGWWLELEPKLTPRIHRGNHRQIHLTERTQVHKEITNLVPRKIQHLLLAKELDMVRLFVGGLSEDITSLDLSQRFLPFGVVENCEVLAPKDSDTFRASHAHCRGFGYLDLEPKDEPALRKCLSVVIHLTLTA
jgi:hypothetical protein